MRSVRTALLLTFTVSLVAWPSVASAQVPATISAELAYRSAYYFAGIPFAADDVTQATVTAGLGSLTLYGFSVYDHAASDVTELDIYGDYYSQIAPTIGLFVGAALYSFKFPSPAGWESTPELYGGLVFTAPLNPTLYVAHDFDLGDGTHATLMLSHAVPMGTGGATLTLSGNLDYNDGYYSTISGFSYADVGASVDLPLGPVTVSPGVTILRGIDDAFGDDEVFSVVAGFTF